MATMTIGALTTGIQTVSTTGEITPTAGLDIAAITGDFTVKLRIVSLTAAKTVRIQLEDSVNGFTAAPACKVWDIKGPVTAGADKVFSARKYELPSLRCGTGSAVARLNIVNISGSTTLAVESWIEY